MIEHYIIKSFVRERALFDKLYPRVSNIVVDGPVSKIIDTVRRYYTEFQEHGYISKDQLNAYFDILYPSIKDRDIYTVIVDRIYEVDTSDSITEMKIKQLQIKDYANQIAQVCIPAISGESFDILDDVKGLLNRAEEITDTEEDEEEGNPFREDSIEDLLEENSGDGLRWRLDCLNDDLGSLPGGTLGHFFARPESGKTSFVHSEMSNYCRQFEERGLGETVLWFNNEEKEKKIKLRWLSAVTGLTKREIAANPTHAMDLYRRYGGNHMGIIDNAVLHIEHIEASMKEYQPRIVIIDVADKCVYKGVNSAVNSAERLKGVYDRLREVSKRCNKLWRVDILTTAQADASCENTKWLYQSNLDSGKTGKAGAFDYIIGMGKLHSEDGVRYIHCCKNKQGDQSGRHVVSFDQMIARYTD